MELQWPLIIFTSLIACSAGIFAAQAIYALKGEGKSAQMPALIASAATLVVSGIAVFFHLQHWERIFNGFGHLTSGITQELIAIVVFAIVMVVYFAMLRRNEGEVPQWTAILAIVVSVVLVAVCGHSYMMAARPGWDSVVWVLALVGAACAMGPAVVAFIIALKGEETASAGILNIVGSAINGVATAAGLFVLTTIGSAFTSFEYYYDLTHPTKDITVGLPSLIGDYGVVTILGVVVIGIIAPIACAIMGKKTGNWKVWGIAIAVCALIGAVCLRVLFYAFGLSVFMFY